MTHSGNLAPCPGCGALFPDVDGPTHPYLGASAGCWAVFGEVLAKEYGEYRVPPVQRLTVDTYAVQHPGVPERRSIRSVAFHLIRLCLVLERGANAQSAVEAILRARASGPAFCWLEPPARLGDFTVLDVRDAPDLAGHTRRVERWARSVWDAWSPHHATIREWAGRSQARAS